MPRRYKDPVTGEVLEVPSMRQMEGVVRDWLDALNLPVPLREEWIRMAKRLSRLLAQEERSLVDAFRSCAQPLRHGRPDEVGS